MLTSLALIFLFGLVLGYLFEKLKLPSLLGMLLTGIILSPYSLNLLDNSILAISPDLRQIALIIILTRAGLAMNLNDLKKVGRPAVLMSFVPALFEIVSIIIFAPILFNISILEAALIGSVVAAVSPAVIVPRMLNLIENKYGTKNGIPQLIMAGSSVDDVFVIILFTSFLSLLTGENVSAVSFLQIPVSIILGLMSGIFLGMVISVFFKNFHIRDSTKVIILLSISFLLISLESYLEDIVPFSGLLAVMSMSAAILFKSSILAERLSAKFSRLWVGAEILLFVLVGATVDINYIASFGLKALLLIIFSIIFRVFGVYLCLLRTQLTIKERLFCMISYIPKATVQAAIGVIPLSMGLKCGQLVLTVAVLSILITAPIGAIFIDKTYEKLLDKD